MGALRFAVPLVAVAVGLSACAATDTSDKRADSKTSSFTMPDVTGVTLDKAYDKIKDAGFANKDAVKIDGGGTFGVAVESNWTVCSQTPAAGAAGRNAPELTIDRSCSDGSAASDDPSDTPSASATPQAPKVLTVKNSPDLKALLNLVDNCSGKVNRFSKKYAGQTIQFDGLIENVLPLGNYHTRFDFLVGPGNFDPNKAIGPTFQFRDKNVFDLNLTGKHVPDDVRAGQKYTFTAQLGDDDPDSCLYQLTPIKTQTR
jgi:Domain of unknown function (DUF4839)/PASTA domain